MEFVKNQLLDVNVTAMSSDGDGIARYEGFAIFVKGGVIGDVLSVRLMKVLKNLAYARIEKIIEPSRDRIKPDCTLFPRCGGCELRHISYAAELAFKKKRIEDAFLKIAGMDIKCDEVIAADNTYNYRNKAVIPLAKRGNRIVGGFFRSHSHDIIELDRCYIQNEVAEQALRAVISYAEQSGASIYDETTGKGLLRKVFVRNTKNADGAIVCIIASNKSLPDKNLLVERLLDLCPALQGIVLNINRLNNNTVLGDKFITLWGNPYITDSLLGINFRISVPSFFQVNPVQAERLYAKAIEFADLSENKTVLDLYCGAGTITLCMAAKAKKAVGIEIVPEAIKDAEINASLNGIENVEFLCGNAGELAAQMAQNGFSPDVIVADPPRHGLDDTAVNVMGSFKPERIVYVSCDPATLARDVQKITAFGYRIHKIAAVDMFPRTRHVECCLLLCRED